jgi:ATP-dependent Clp protease ATP-binding subunit ClpC
MYPFERFSENAKRVLTLAQEEAEIAHHSYIGTEHLLLGLAREETGLAAAALREMGLNNDDLRADLAKVLQAKSPPTPLEQMVPTSRVKRIIEMSFEEARQEGMSQVETEHMLVAMLSEGEGVAAHVLRNRGVTVDRLRTAIAGLRSGGKVEERHGSTGARHRRHLALSDEEGHPISVDVLFPAEYSRLRQDQVLERIMKAIKTAEPPP